MIPDVFFYLFIRILFLAVLLISGTIIVVLSWKLSEKQRQLDDLKRELEEMKRKHM